MTVRSIALAVASLLATTSATHAQENSEQLRRVTFDEAVRLVLLRNAAVRIADQEIARSKALVTESRSTWFPVVLGTAGYTRLEDDRTVAGRLSNAADSFTAAVSVNAPIVAVKGWAQTRHAEDQVAVTRASAADVRRELAVATGRAYLAVLASQRQLDVATIAVGVAKAHVDYARARFAGGLGNEIDQARADQELAADQAQVAQARLGLTRAREALGVLISGEEPVDVNGDPSFDLPIAGTDAIAEANSKRADVLLSRQRLAAADAARKDDWTDYAPVLGILGQAFYTSPQVDPIPRWGFQAQLVLTVPIYDGGLRTGQEREREVTQIEAHEDLDATLRQARSEVRAAADEVARAQDSLQSTRGSATAARRALDLTTTGYKAGASTSLEVTDAERTARDADTSVVIAEDALRQAELDLLASTGRFPPK